MAQARLPGWAAFPTSKSVRSSNSHHAFVINPLARQKSRHPNDDRTAPELTTQPPRCQWNQHALNIAFAFPKQRKRLI